MAVYTCPKGHDSTEEDFCSECGAKISGSRNNANIISPRSSTDNTCPDCRSPRTGANAIFCEVCGYDYQTGRHGELPLSPTATALPETVSTTSWIVVVCADVSLKEEGSPDPPADLAASSFPIDSEQLLIGRRSEVRGIFPDISLDFDSAVSHRHALLLRQPDKTLLLRDIGSSNGTRINGSDIPPLTDVAVSEGDRITLGHWSCLTIEKAK